MSAARPAVTRLLANLLKGDAAAGEEVMPLIYAELRDLAGMIMKGKGSVDFQPTELVHEAYVRLVDVDGDAVREVESRLHFKRLAARAMHGILVDRARANRAAKRGGPRGPSTLHEDAVASAHDDAAVIEVHDGLEILRRTDPRLADMVEMRFFGGMTVEEVAVSLGVSASTVHRDWRLVRAWWLEEYPSESSPE